MARDLKINNQALDPNLYVYRQARDVSKTQVDWANLTKELTDDLSKIRDDREKTRQDAIDANRELLNTLNDIDPYAHETANTKIQGAAYDASQLLMTDFNLVVNGQKKLKDYKQTEQLLSDNFTSLKGAMDTYNDHFIEATERVKNGEANFDEIFNNNSLAGFGSMESINIVVQPSGSISLIKKQFDANGNEIEVDVSNPANVLPLSHLNNRIQFESNYEDPNEAAQATVETLGAFITGSFLSQQRVQTLEDFRNMNYTDAVSGDERTGAGVILSMAQELLATNQQKFSMLRLAGYSEKDMTVDPEEAKRTGKILQIPNINGSGTMGYEFTEKHEQDMLRTAQMVIERQIDSKISLTKGVTPPSTNVYDFTQQQVEATSSGLLELVDGVTTGNAELSEASASSLVDILNRTSGTTGDQAKRITAIEKKINADGTIDIVISREGISDKTISSKGKTTDEFEMEFYNTINTTDQPYEEAKKDYGTIGGTFGVEAMSYNAPAETFEIEAPNVFTPLGTGEGGTGLMLIDYIANSMGTSQRTETTKVDKIDLSALEDSIELLLDTKPGLRDEINRRGGVNVEIRKNSAGKDRMYIDIPGSNSFSWSISGSTSAKSINETIGTMLENSVETFSEDAPGSKILNGE